MRILIEVPTYDGRISPHTSESLWRLDRGGHEVDYRPCAGYGCAMARNRIAADALAGGYDRLLMVDNDIELPSDALLNLLEDDVDIAMGWYLTRHGDGTRTTAFKLGDGWESYTARELLDMRDAGRHVVQVKGGGMGCCMFKPWVFTTLIFPWFEWTDWGWGPVDAEGVYEMAAKVRSGGEDVNFCENARAAGLRVHVDTRVACGHEFRDVRWPE